MHCRLISGEKLFIDSRIMHGVNSQAETVLTLFAASCLSKGASVSTIGYGVEAWRGEVMSHGCLLTVSRCSLQDAVRGI